MRRRDFLAGGAVILTAGLSHAQTDALSQSAFDDWVAAVRPKALTGGVAGSTWDLALQGLTPDPVVIARRATAAETNRTITDYVVGLLTGRGQKARDKYAGLPQLAQVEQRYGVPGGPLVAFWGMESDYGANIGDRDVLRATATHGAAGSGGPDWTAEFIAALKILQSGVVPRERLLGSYAGAIGQTQLMPSNYLKYGVDFDGDGRVDVWAQPLDALASTAVHLGRGAGWRRNEGWLEEVALPAGFDLTRVEVEVTALSPSAWEALGVRKAVDRPWTAEEKAETARLMLPAGVTGPAFLALPNYAAFEDYNPSLPYAIGVCLLARFAAGQDAIWKSWPKETALTRETRMAAQAGLARLGYYDGKIDGDLGKKSRQALRAWQLASRLPRDGKLSADQAMTLSQ